MLEEVRFDPFDDRHWQVERYGKGCEEHLLFMEEWEMITRLVKRLMESWEVTTSWMCVEW